MHILLFLITALVLASCNRVNKLDKPTHQQVIDWADKRKTNQLVELLQSEDWELAELAALKLASVQDENALPYLLQIVEDKEKLSSLRKNALFAIGLTDINGLVSNQLALLIPSLATEKDIFEELIIALGRSHRHFEDFIDNGIAVIGNETAIARASVYHSIQFRINAKLRSVLLDIIQSKDYEAKLYAATALQRSRLNEDDCKKLLQHIENENNDEVNYFLLAACKSCSLDEYFIDKIINSPAGQSRLSRIGLLRGWKQVQLTSIEGLLKQIFQEGDFSLQDVAAQFIYSSVDENRKKIARQILLSNTKLYHEAEAKLYATLLENATLSEADGISGVIDQRYQLAENEYHKMSLLRAFGSHWSNFTWLQTEAFNTESILIRLASIEGILNIRKHPSFDSHNKQWQQNAPKSANLFQLIAQSIQDGLETYDVGVCATIADFLLDTTVIPDPTVRNQPFRIALSDTSVLTRALRKMRLPRDIETYNALISARNLYQQQKKSGSAKIEFNNPIDWNLVNRIPEKQDVKISTNRGDIYLRLFVNEAPATTGFFIKLIRDGYFVGKSFHRVVPGFVVQAGCPRGDGFGGLMETLRTEISYLRYQKAGLLGMASAGKDTESSQFFITLAPTPHLDGRYTLFGEVTKGLDVLQQIIIGDRITDTAIMP
ncbi:MAG: peptidylprolyl isomerase [Flavobacteriales bacterium]